MIKDSRRGCARWPLGHEVALAVVLIGRRRGRFLYRVWHEDSQIEAGSLGVLHVVLVGPADYDCASEVVVTMVRWSGSANGRGTERPWFRRHSGARGDGVGACASPAHRRARKERRSVACAETW